MKLKGRFNLTPETWEFGDYLPASINEAWAYKFLNENVNDLLDPDQEGSHVAVSCVESDLRKRDMVVAIILDGHGKGVEFETSLSEILDYFLTGGVDLPSYKKAAAVLRHFADRIEDVGVRLQKTSETTKRQLEKET